MIDPLYRHESADGADYRSLRDGSSARLRRFGLGPHHAWINHHHHRDSRDASRDRGRTCDHRISIRRHFQVFSELSFYYAAMQMRHHLAAVARRAIQPAERPP